MKTIHAHSGVRAPKKVTTARGEEDDDRLGGEETEERVERRGRKMDKEGCPVPQ